MILWANPWYAVVANGSELDQIRVPRCLQLQTEGAPVDTSLHTFVDASQDAYGAVGRYGGRLSKAEAQDVQESTLISVVTEGPLNWRLNPLRFSSWIRLVRVHAWVSRSLDNCCLPKEQRTAGEITLEQIKAAEIQIITRAQQEAFANEYLLIAKGKELLS